MQPADLQNPLYMHDYSFNTVAGMSLHATIFNNIFIDIVSISFNTVAGMSLHATSWLLYSRRMLPLACFNTVAGMSLHATADSLTDSSISFIWEFQYRCRYEPACNLRPVM